MSVKTHITDFGDVSPCSAVKSKCPFSGNDAGIDGHLIFANDAEVKTYNNLVTEFNNGGTFGKGMSESKMNELTELENSSLKRAKDAVKFAIHNIPKNVATMNLRANDPDYRGYTGETPTINGAVIEIEETGERLTIQTEIAGESLRGDRARIVPKLINDEGEEVSRYIPGPKYRVVSIPDTYEAKEVLKNLVLGKKTLQSVREFENVQMDLQNEIYIAAKKDISVYTNKLISQDGKTIPVMTVRGANKDGSKSFTIAFNADGDIVQSRGIESNLSKKSLEVVQNKKELLQKLHSKRILADEASKKYSANSEEVRKYNDYL